MTFTMKKLRKCGKKLKFVNARLFDVFKRCWARNLNERKLKTQELA